MSEEAPKNGQYEEWHLKHRPSKLKEMVGQAEAVQVIAKFLEQGTVPHSMMFHGPPGCGKTTLARILAAELGAPYGSADFKEINAAEDRNMDMVRKVQNLMRLAPRGASRKRVWVFDEAHHINKREGGDAQTALLKTIEEPPHHCYFFLCTSHPHDLRPALRQRCTAVQLGTVSREDIYKVLSRISRREGAQFEESVLDQAIEAADGSPRDALKHLYTASKLPTAEEQLAYLNKINIKKHSKDLVRALIWEKKSWKEVCKIIADMDEGEDWERLRRRLISASTKEALKDKPGTKLRAMAVMREFERNFYDSGRASFVLAAYLVAISQKE